MTNSRRGAAATTTGPCTEAMSHPTPSPDFAISPALEEQIARAAELVARRAQRGGADRRRPLGRERDPALPRARRAVDEVRRAAARRLPALPARSQASLAGPPLAARALGAGARRDARRGQAQRRPPRARRARSHRPLRRRHHPEHRRPPPPGRRPRPDRDPRQPQAAALPRLRRALRGRASSRSTPRGSRRAVPAAGAW